MSYLVQKSGPPVERVSDLLDYVARATKPRAAHRIGIELEGLPVDARTGEAPPSAATVESVLSALARQPGYEAVLEGERVVLVQKGERNVGLEPGGQVELSGTPSATIAGVADDLAEHLGDLARVAPDGLRLLAMGEQPISTLDAIPWVPKARYELLAGFLAPRGRLGHHMMKKTATVQASVDFASVEEAMRMLRCGLIATPVLVGLSANSPYVDGRAVGWLSHRTAIWKETDPSRSGVLPAALSRSFDLEAYVAHVLDLPVVFLQRGGGWRSGSGATFRQLLADGIPEADGKRTPPTLFDWELHLSSFFPDVRLKRVIEVRGADCPPRPLIVPLAALVLGLFGTDAGLSCVEERLGAISADVYLRLHEAAARRGLEAESDGLSVATLARAFVDGARRGLAERARETGMPDEGASLDPFEELIERRASPARTLIERFGEEIREPARLVEATDLLAQAPS